MLSDSTRGSGHKHFHINMRKMIFESGGALEQAAQKGCGTSSGDTKSLPSCDPVQPTPGEPADVQGGWTRGPPAIPSNASYSLQ